jgi:hypothetical protein
LGFPTVTGEDEESVGDVAVATVTLALLPLGLAV